MTHNDTCIGSGWVTLMWMVLGKDRQQSVCVCVGDWKFLTPEVGVVLGHGQKVIIGDYLI